MISPLNPMQRSIVLHSKPEAALEKVSEWVDNATLPKQSILYPLVALVKAQRQIFKAIYADFQAIFERDPAARNWLEVLVCYPGFHALVFHRFAHVLHQTGLPFLPRLISHLARFLTGVEIHPGATLGQGIVIDHGMGVVIGETTIVGDDCLIYQNATLGGTGKESGKRHPTLGRGVVVGAGAKVLGNIHIGDNARIGAGSIVLRDVPANCTAVGVPGRNLCRTNVPECPLDHNKLPDAEATVIRTLLDRIESLEAQLQELKQGSLVAVSREARR